MRYLPLVIGSAYETNVSMEITIWLNILRKLKWRQESAVVCSLALVKKSSMSSKENRALYSLSNDCDAVFKERIFNLHPELKEGVTTLQLE